MGALPHGTVTFAFTDIEGSTALLKMLGDGYGEVLSTHRRLLREAFTSRDGVEIDTQGDAFFFAFVRAGDAVDAAVAVQRAHVTQEWPEGVSVRVRVGLHTGEPTVGEEGYLGLDVVRAARLCSTGTGGQVLLSETTRALVGSKLPDGVTVFPLGERHLKDIDEPERVFELGIEGVVASPPPPDRATTGADEPAVPAPPSWEENLEQRINRFAERLTNRVFSSVERKFTKEGDEEPSDDGDLAGLEGIAARAEELAVRIKGDVEN